MGGEQVQRMRPAGPVRGTIRPPGSKSLTNRALVCAALAEGTSRLAGCLDSRDTRVMRESLERLGIDIAIDEPGHLRIAGCGGRIPARHAELWTENSGTTIRFLTAVAATGHGWFRLDGNDRMRRRPIGDLVAALRQLGVDIRAAGGNRFPPVELRAGGLAGGRVTMRADVSSQFLSGLLMAAPAAQAPLTIELDGPLVSRPYVDMTLAVMRKFGAEVSTESDRVLTVDAPCPYRGLDDAIEPDASAASYFWAAAAVTGGRVTVQGLHRHALQGDVAFVDCLAQMGCRVEETERGIAVEGGPLRGVDVDMNAISDTMPTLAVVALFAQGPTTIRGVSHVRHKESDRIGDVARELRKLGAEVIEHADGMTIVPGTPGAARIATYDDHRIAMSFAVAGLVVPGIVIEDPDCVAKTYPEFFEDLRRLVNGGDHERRAD